MSERQPKVLRFAASRFTQSHSPRCRESNGRGDWTSLVLSTCGGLARDKLLVHSRAITSFPEVFSMFPMVGATGLEPATTCTPCKHSSQLNYAPNDRGEYSLANADQHAANEVSRMMTASRTDEQSESGAGLNYAPSFCSITDSGDAGGTKSGACGGVWQFKLPVFLPVAGVYRQLKAVKSLAEGRVSR
ncbi:MAG: hypothetical protein UY87_C0048G0009 [Candidatus Peribacteria bacterium GW2011_GWC2_54_8]|nr:MAG: hypothetical protein UY87_C0048G0009 [Candidatus Peribacteria bacterium GW2011_GWC2_54_8]KKW41276.1 MAG: hypothetical protein UY90_C0059G0005 [Candidatus Peregrinibacteria bacterium GW2011_GWA2_54_9]